jgi:hypothetical protein
MLSDVEKIDAIFFLDRWIHRRYIVGHQGDED